MSKYIKFTESMREEARREFEQSLLNAKVADGKISFTKTLTAPQTRATLYFTPVAFAKMLMLVAEFSDEVAWHGTAFRGDDPQKHEYCITDIMVYPQEVTGSTVNTDQAKYQTWLMEQPDDVFSHIRMQGHSHVNMATNPSSVDLTHQSRILDQLDDDMFYIFIIWNKKMERNIKIYDLDKNILFEPSDIDVAITQEGVDFSAFISDAKAKVSRKVYVTPTYQGGYDRSYNGYRGSSYYADQYARPAYNSQPAKTSDKPITKPIPAEKLPVAKEPTKTMDDHSKVIDLRPKSTMSAGWDDTVDYDEIYGQQYIQDDAGRFGSSK